MRSSARTAGAVSVLVVGIALFGAGEARAQNDCTACAEAACRAFAEACLTTLIDACAQAACGALGSALDALCSATPAVPLKAPLRAPLALPLPPGPPRKGRPMAF